MDSNQYSILLYFYLFCFLYNLNVSELNKTYQNHNNTSYVAFTLNVICTAGASSLNVKSIHWFNQGPCGAIWLLGAHSQFKYLNFDKW